MSPPAPPRVTLAHWLAVLVVWGLAAYGALTSPKAEARREPVRLVACR
jgi:hypothetical protein